MVPPPPNEMVQRAQTGMRPPQARAAPVYDIRPHAGTGRGILRHGREGCSVASFRRRMPKPPNNPGSVISEDESLPEEDMVSTLDDVCLRCYEQQMRDTEDAALLADLESELVAIKRHDLVGDGGW